MDSVEQSSPDGRFLVRFDIDHGRMSHEIWTPTVVETATGRTLLHIRRNGIDGRPQWRPCGFALALRCYHHPLLALSLSVDVDRAIFRFDGHASDEPLATLSDRVDEELGRQMKSADRSSESVQRRRAASDVLVLVAGMTALVVAGWFAFGR